MKKFLLVSSLISGGILSAQNSKTFTVQSIQKQFKYEKYPKEVLEKFSEYPTSQYSEIFEEIPGEIISYSNDEGIPSSRYYGSFLVKGRELIPINVYPINDDDEILKDFNDKVSEFVGKNWRFEDRAGYGIKKLRNGDYLISTNYYAENESSVAPSGYLEYTTKDFKNFTPYRISQDEKNWKIIR